MQSTDDSGLPLAYRVKEACNKLSISRSVFYEQVAQGHLKVKKSGRRTLVPASQIKAWLESLPDKAA